MKKTIKKLKISKELKVTKKEKAVIKRLLKPKSINEADSLYIQFESTIDLIKYYADKNDANKIKKLCDLLENINLQIYSKIEDSLLNLQRDLLL